MSVCASKIPTGAWAFTSLETARGITLVRMKQQVVERIEDPG
jgi:hypothetical protein